MSANPARRAAERRGHRGEGVAAWRLRLAGYRIVARNVRTPVGEIDLIACRNRVLVFVEVKARPDKDEAAWAITPRQQARVRRAAEAFLAGRPELAHLACRFDAVLVAPWRLPKHVIDAWRD